MTDERTGLLSDTRGGAAYETISTSTHGSTSPHGLRRQLSLAHVNEAITLSWRNLDAYVIPEDKGCCGRGGGSTESKQIIKNVNGIVMPGTLTAIMGASGAGKSTFMNILTHRNLEGLNISGEVLVNGENLGKGITKVSAYVQQDDLFIGTMKVKEQLWFQARLKLPKSLSKFDVESRIQTVMTELGLQKCANTQIGAAGGKKGISGGERKRLAFASEVLTNPALMFCDEPTSGLDSFMAMSVVQVLKNMAERGKTILCTIHQPSSEVFALFDSILLLAEGKLAYMGSAKEALVFFDKVGYPCPVNFNPADHYIYNLAIKPGKEQQCHKKVQEICSEYEKSPQFEEIKNELRNEGGGADFSSTIHALKHGSRYQAAWYTQFQLLIWRSAIANARDPMIFRARFVQSFVIGLFIGLVYFQVPYDSKGVQNINGGLFLILISASLGNVFAVVNTFPLEFPVFKREHQSGMYGVGAYYIGKILAETPTFIFMPTLLITIAYFMMGLYNSVEAYAVAVAALVVVANVSVSFGYVMSTVSSNLNLILSMAPLVMTPLMMFGGLFMNASSVPVYFIWLQYLSWFNYCNEILIVNQWRNVENITCSVPDIPLNPNTTVPPNAGGGLCYSSGQMVIDSLSYTNDNIVNDFIIMIALMVGFRIISFLLLLLRSRQK